MMKIGPRITRKIPFGQHACDLFFGVNATNLNVWVQVILVEQPIQSNSVGPRNMPHFFVDMDG